MKRQLRILSAIDIPWNSALAAYALDQARALRERGHRVVIAAPETSFSYRQAQLEGFPVFAVSDRKSLLSPLLALALRRYLKREGVEIFCAHTGRMQTLGALCLPGLPLRLVRTKADASRSSAGLSLRPVSAIIAASGAIKAAFAGAPPEKIKVVPQSIDLPAYVPPPAEGFRVGLLGRLDPVKGHDVFLKAAREVLEKFPQARFVCAGKDSNLTRGELVDLAERLEIKDSVEFVGHTADPIAFINSCHAGVISSVGSEAVSRALLEWMACGRPAAAAAVGGIPEMLPPAWLFTPGDHGALAALLCRLAGDPALRASASEENRKAAAEKFSRGLFAAETEKVLLEVLPA
jgi:glycosyltransferase involved in cell wall biosynthesis